METAHIASADIPALIARLRAIHLDRMRSAIRSNPASISELAKRVGMTRKQLSAVYHGTYDPSPRVCQLIIEACE